MSSIVRFAPSPTGKIHVGNVRLALLNWLYAKKTGGKFILRLDDTDLERSTKEYEEGIKTDLKWLGLNWDQVEWQSKRLERYEIAFNKLKDLGRVYPCYETPEELEFMRKRLMSRGKPPIYDRSALSLTPEQIKAFEDEGRKAHWRFKLSGNDVAWVDLVRGKTHFKGEILVDPVIRRANGTFLYMMPSVVDDIDMNVTMIMRGEDHVNNTAVQSEMFELLGGDIPEFAHLPLIAGKSGEKLSKSAGSLPIEASRDAGLEPMSITSFLSALGTSNNIEVHKSLEDLIPSFDLGNFGRATAKFDPDEIVRLNSKLVHDMTFEEAKSKLENEDISNVSEEFWLAIKQNITTIKEAKDWYNLIYSPVQPIVENGEFAEQALAVLPALPWNENTWKEWTTAVKDSTGAKGKQLFMPLRQILTGLDHGPELKVLLPLIGYDTVVKRLKGEKA